MTGKQHPKEAEDFNKNFDRTTWHDEALWFVRQKRDKAAYGIKEFQQLREQASAIKDHTLSNLDDYLQMFEKHATQNGVKVHWATTAMEHNEIVLNILRTNNATRVVKSKSMLTEECKLNGYLKNNGIDVVDTDLGERIIQLRGEAPSHIVLPAIHLKKDDVGKTFHQHLGTAAGENDPQNLAEAARQHLRKKFMAAEAAISGVNFAIAETGSIVVCTNEGNADLGINLSKVHIASIGIEKIIPRWTDLGVFTRLLSRSATGQAITTYTSHFTKPVNGGKMHFIIVDNGRTQQLGRADFRNSLKCIRCGACMNTCPVYRRSGGHSYNFTVPGPIGSILSPNIDLKKYSTLPFASTLCGSCSDVCPVKIDIHVQLYKWRQLIGNNNVLPASKKWSMKFIAGILSRPRIYYLGGKFARAVMRTLPKSILNNSTLNPWVRARELPRPPSTSFKEWYKENRK